RARVRRRPGGRVGGLRADDDAALGQGPRVPGGVPRRHGGGPVPASALAHRPRRARGGAAARLRRHDARHAAAVPHLRRAAAADHLSREEANEVTVVDVNEDVLRELQDRLDVRTVAGNAAHPSVLEAAGTAETDIIVALTSSDEVNMMACEVAFTLFRTPTKI